MELERDVPPLCPVSGSWADEATCARWAISPNATLWCPLPPHTHHMWPSEDPHRIRHRKALRSCRHDTCRARTGNGGESCRNNRKLWTQLGGTVPNSESHHLVVCPSSTSTHYAFRFHSHHIDYYTIHPHQYYLLKQFTSDKWHQTTGYPSFKYADCGFSQHDRSNK